MESTPFIFVLWCVLFDKIAWLPKKPGVENDSPDSQVHGGGVLPSYNHIDSTLDE